MCVDGAFLKNDQAGGTRAQIHEADAEFALVIAQDRICTGERLENRVVHVNAGAIHRRDDVLRGAAAAVTMCTRTSSRMAIMPRGIMHAALIVQNEFLRQQVENFAICGQGNGPRLIHCGADFVAGNFAGPRAKAEAAMAIHAAHVRSSHSQQGVLDGSSG